MTAIYFVSMCLLCVIYLFVQFERSVSFIIFSLKKRESLCLRNMVLFIKFRHVHDAILLTAYLDFVRIACASRMLHFFFFFKCNFPSLISLQNVVATCTTKTYSLFRPKSVAKNLNRTSPHFPVHLFAMLKKLIRLSLS